MFASVRIAKNSLGSSIAMKTYYHGDLQNNSRILQHAQNEERLVGKLNHPHIIAPRMVHHRRGCTEFEMDYASGGNLYEYVHAHEHGLGEFEARRLFGQVVSAMKYLHERNIFHRDIKLENIVLDERGDARLVDFGTAAIDSIILQSQQGTPVYMAPEVVQGNAHAGAPADVWSLGVLLCVMLGGPFPFWGNNLIDLCCNITTQPPTLPIRCSKGANDLLHRLLTKNTFTRICINDVQCHPWLWD